MTRIQLLLLLGAVVGLATVVRTASVDSSSDSDQSDGEADAASVFPGLVSALGAQLGPDAAILGAEDEETEEDDEPTAPCCFPRTWQGKMVSQIGVAGRKASLVRALDQVYVDGANQRLAGDKMDFLGRGKVLNFSYIMLVRPNKTASLYLFSKSAQKCRTQTLKNVVWRPQCIPSNATFRGSLSLGPSAGGLTVQCWTFHVAAKAAAAAVDTSARPSPRPPRVFVGGDILVTPGQCIPVVLQEHGVVTRGGPRPQDDVFDDEFNGNDDDDSEDEDKPKPRPSPRPRPKPRPRGEAFAASFFYSNIATSIRDPSVFTPPSYCGKTSNGLFYDDLSEAEEELSTVLDRFLIL